MKVPSFDDKFQRRFESWLLRFVCPVPEVTEATDYAFNDDLSQLSGEEAQGQLARVKLRLLLDPDPHPWLIQRHKLLIQQVGAKNE